MGDTYDYEPNPIDEEDSFVRCKFCGKEPLEWKLISDKWILLDIFGRRHICANKLKSTALNSVEKIG